MEEKKSKIEICIEEYKVNNMFSMFKGFVLERNISECKKYGHKVIIYKNHVEVIFNVVLVLGKRLRN
ncbi:hypothetical protein LAV60_00970 [Clostridium sporogenes]|uniref:hypothetical protein n=1 Tax=Clostridium sporogenes TaxID=1509 RepID=UPI0022373E44|nr:hypothetical protein [Clostridium sporogenes]MCW6091720.1 hypothetical protein [Clostridium sporogenes]MCW6091737.1 hypothetical protein [Clostridium sporogenes]